ncbi:EF-hand domain-containing protein D1 [Elysia marginata]|uniref:EF-hand domain-containing protein D1 n=1 Tax=Elysia marginata TaxID=1093978 RepID=A0AAV4HIC3_9GAST|nr:EF-hand domain-containing protein D1 [Elysia marginata]
MIRNQERVPWLMCLFILATGADDFQCVDNGTSAQSGNVPHMPTVTKDSDSYQATVEVNILDKGYSYVVDEFLDYEGNRALMRVYKSGFKSSYIFSYDTDEVFSISNNLCKVSNISDSRFGFVVGGGSQTSGGGGGGDRRHIFGSAAVLRFAADKHDVYNGTSEVRGVPADVYSTCITWQGVVGKARATYYFSQANWNTSAPRKQLPLRIEVEGLTSLPVWGRGPPPPTSQPPKPRYFHHVYDFINYLPYIAADPAIFLTPPNVVCENRVVTRAFPKLGRFFSFRSEEIDPLSGIVEHRHLWYDQDAKMTRVDYRYEPPGSGQYTNGISSIGDFNTGSVSFTADDWLTGLFNPSAILDFLPYGLRPPERADNQFKSAGCRNLHIATL